MRKMILAAAMAGTALTLSACGETAEAPAEEETVDTAETTDATDEATGPIDANTATAEDLAGVEGVSEELAATIVAGQPYATVLDLNAVLTEAVSAEEAAAVLVNVFVPINLNTASEEEIALIPGMTPRMIHEFEEYRPYADMETFNREIGKYVDEEEVARLASYVTL